MKKSNALSFEKAVEIVKPVFYDAPGFDMNWSPGKQLSDSEKEEMEKRFVDSATFLEVK